MSQFGSEVRILSYCLIAEDVNTKIYKNYNFVYCFVRKWYLVSYVKERVEAAEENIWSKGVVPKMIMGKTARRRISWLKLFCQILFGGSNPTHTASVWKTRNTYKVLVEKSVGKRILARRTIQLIE